MTSRRPARGASILRSAIQTAGRDLGATRYGQGEPGDLTCRLDAHAGGTLRPGRHRKALSDEIDQAATLKIILGQDDHATTGFGRARVVPLMIVASLSEWRHDRRLAETGDFCQRRCPSTGQHEIGGGQGVDEVVQVRRGAIAAMVSQDLPASLAGNARVTERLVASLVQDLQAKPRDQPVPHLGDGAVERWRAQRTAGDEQCGHARQKVEASTSRFGSRRPGESLAHRVARDHRTPAEPSSCSDTDYRDDGRQRREPAVRPAWNLVGLVQDDPNPRRSCSEDHGRADCAANGHDHGRVNAAQIGHRPQSCDRQAGRPAELPHEQRGTTLAPIDKPGEHAFAVQLGPARYGVDANVVEGEVGLAGHQPVLDVVATADVVDLFHPGGPEPLTDGDRHRGVTAKAAARQHHPHPAGVRVNTRSRVGNQQATGGTHSCIVSVPGTEGGVVLSISMLARIRGLYHLLDAGYRRRWVLLVPLSALEALLESTGAAGVFLLIGVIQEPAAVFDVPVIAALFGACGWRQGRVVVVAFTLILVAFYFIKNLYLLLFTFVRTRLANMTIATLSAALVRRYLKADYSFFFHRNSAELIDRASSGVETAVRMLLASAVGALVELLVLAGMTVVLLVASPLIALGSLAVLTVILSLLLLTSRRVFHTLGVNQQHHRRTALQTLQQAIGAIKETQVMERQRYWSASFEHHQQRLQRVRAWHETLNAAPRILIETAFVAIPLILILVTTGSVSSRPQALPLLALFAYAGFRAIPSFNRLSMYANNMRLGSPEADALLRDFRDLPRDVTPALAEPVEAPPLEFKNTLALEGVSFSYEDGGVRVLSDISFVLHRGESVGIAGRTGVGKSTLVDLVLGLIRPTGGTILVDGVSIHANLPSWRSKIGYVPQTIYLIDDTLRRNIAFGVPDPEIDEGNLRGSLDLAQLGSLLGSLPHGLDTVVGERGITLSGGERQRLAIARALYRKPELLVLDEATSALDTATESSLSAALRSLRGRVTMLLIAHRPQTLSHCDRVVYLEDGRLTARQGVE